MVRPIVLASTSPFRAEQLRAAAIPFEADAPVCDEDAPEFVALEPRARASALARAKAESVAQRQPDAIVIGSDQICLAPTGEALGKPGSRDRAIEQLVALAGQTHHLLTAVCVVCAGERFEHLDETALTVRHLDRPALERYVDLDIPLACAGSYKIESAGILLFEHIDSRDPSAIVGLPLLATVRALAKFGVTLP